MRKLLRMNVALVGLAGLLAVGVGVGVAGGQASGIRFENDLVGTEEVPVADLDGKGTSMVKINPSTGEVCFTFRFKSTGTPNRATSTAGRLA